MSAPQPPYTHDVPCYVRGAAARAPLSTTFPRALPLAARAGRRRRRERRVTVRLRYEGRARIPQHATQSQTRRLSKVELPWHRRRSRLALYRVAFPLEN